MRQEIKFTEEQLLDIKQSYLAGESTVKIGQRYGTSHQPILKALKRMNIERTPSKFNRKYSLNETYFDIIDNPNKAYILGLLYADGSNNISKSTISISLQEEDGYLLEAIRNEMQSDKPLEYLDYSNKHDYGYNYKNQYRLLLFSSHMCHTLNNLGMMPNKSLKLEVPNLRQDLYPHFIRGYFDGDGSLCVRHTADGLFRSITTITSTEKFCRKIQSIIKESIDIPCGNIYDASCKNGITRVLTISGRIQNQKFHEWIYKDADLYLQRKREKVNDLYVA